MLGLGAFGGMPELQVFDIISGLISVGIAYALGNGAALEED